MTDPEHNRRHPDYETSVQGAYVSRAAKESQALRLLSAWGTAGTEGFTYAEAVEVAGIPDGEGCPWKRAGELRERGLLEWLRDEDGKIVKRRNERYRAMVNQGVSVITLAGRERLRAS